MYFIYISRTFFFGPPLRHSGGRGRGVGGPAWSLRLVEAAEGRAVAFLAAPQGFGLSSRALPAKPSLPT